MELSVLCNYFIIIKSVKFNLIKFNNSKNIYELYVFNYISNYLTKSSNSNLINNTFFLILKNEYNSNCI